MLSLISSIRKRFATGNIPPLLRVYVKCDFLMVISDFFIVIGQKFEYDVLLPPKKIIALPVAIFK